MMPGYSAVMDLETISGPDAVMVKRYRDLTLALELPYPWYWGIGFNSTTLAANSRALDFLDVKYVFSPQELSGLALVDREPRALLYRRATAWPRAFFTDKVETFDSLAALAQRIRGGAPGPFVAVDRSDGKSMSLAAHFEGSPSVAGRVVRAQDYSLTTNSTSFTIVAPAAEVRVSRRSRRPGRLQGVGQRTAHPLFRSQLCVQGRRHSGTRDLPHYFQLLASSPDPVLGRRRNRRGLMDWCDGIFLVAFAPYDRLFRRAR